MLREHRHVCAFFNSSEDEYRTLLPFICDGLQCGQRAYHVMPRRYRDEHLQRLVRAGIDVNEVQRTRQLEIAYSEDVYLRDGHFNQDAMLARIQKVLGEGTALGFPLTRLIAHAEMVLEDFHSGIEWVEYEMRLNEVLPSYGDPVICTFDVNMLNGSLALDILRTHPVAIVGGVLIENSFFSTPGEFLREIRERNGVSPTAYRG
jgi:hypothetical protein